MKAIRMHASRRMHVMQVRRYDKNKVHNKGGCLIHIDAALSGSLVLLIIFFLTSPRTGATPRSCMRSPAFAHCNANVNHQHCVRDASAESGSDTTDSGVLGFSCWHVWRTNQSTALNSKGAGCLAALGGRMACLLVRKCAHSPLHCRYQLLTDIICWNTLREPVSSRLITSTARLL